MKKIIILMFVALVLGVFTVARAATKDVKKTAEAMGIYTEEKAYDSFWKPVIEQYNKGNYLGVVPILQKRVEGEVYGESGDLERYYLAMCYHNMGYTTNAKMMYMQIIEKNNDPKLVFYSQKAMACLDDPKSQLCTGKMPAPELTDIERAQQDRIKQLEAQLKDMDSQMHPVQNVQADDDITRFIKSKQKIHPAAMDRITTERMERKLQEAEYKRKQEEANQVQ